MSNASNLYAEKVFSEHPLSIWPLDETVDYLSLISDAQRDLSNNSIWTKTQCSVVVNTTLDPQIIDQDIYELNSTSEQEFEIFADNLINDYVNEELESISIGFYFYPQSEHIESIEVGYRYDPNGLPRNVNSAERVEEIQISEYSKWQYISKTFELPSKERLTINAANDNLIITTGNPTVIDIGSHGLAEGDKLRIESDFAMPSGLNKYKTYYVVNLDEYDNTFELAESPTADPLSFNYPPIGNLYLVLVKSITPFIRYNSNLPWPAKSYIHAFTIGQWSEEFSQYSTGSFIEEISGIAIDEEYYGITASSYGLQEFPAYYLARENKLLANNTNLPMVYGSSFLTSLYPERFGGPSIIIPGLGMLNEAGRYKTYTLEFWLRINPDIREPKRIVGPISSLDGLYIDGESFILKVGDNIASHYIGEWYRPMLINMLVFRNGASLTINGEKVVDLTFDSKDLDLPAATNLAGKDQDWIGFYSYTNIALYEIDCIAIYSYRVPTVVAKRRWVYGQGVDFPEDVASAYTGKSFPIDYTFANYSNNLIYPDMTRWQQGTLENVSTNNNVLQPPPYELPDVIFNNKSTEAWNRSLSSNYADAITLKPDDSWADTDGYLFFNTANVLEQKTAGFYCVLEAPFGYDANQTLFRLENALTGNYLNVKLTTDIITVDSIEDSTKIISSNHGLLDNDIISFFGDVPYDSFLEEDKEYYVVNASKNYFYVSDSKNGDPINIGEIEEYDSLQIVAYFIKYYLKFNSAIESLVYKTPAITLGHTFVAGINFSKFANYFGGNVASFVNSRRQLKLYVGGNKNFTDTFSGDIYRIGFCTENNVDKLSYLFDNKGIPFLRYQFDGGNQEYDYNYPDYDIWEESEIVDAGYAYEDYINDILSHRASYTLVLKDFFGTRYLDIATNSNWQDYIPLNYFAKKFVDSDGKEYYGVDFIQYNSDTATPLIFDDGDYDLSDVSVKTYISFQLVELGATKSADYFTETKALPKNKIVDPGSDWMTTKYEVVSGTLIYPPPNVNVDKVALVVHVDISSEGIIRNPVRMRSLQLASKTFNKLLDNPIQTRFGVPLYPYQKYGIYYDYSKEKSFIIYKESTPHLYLTKHSGIELTGSFASSRGISVPVNKERVETYDLSNIQFFMKFNRNDIVTEPKEIMHIEDGTAGFLKKIWIAPSIPSDKRFFLYATDENNIVDSSILFSINGRMLSNPTVSVNAWNMVSISFINPIDIGGRSGAINFLGPIMFNNVSYFALNAPQKAKLSIINEPEYVGINPDLVYDIFTGTNKIIFGDNIPLILSKYRYAVLNDISVQSATIKPV